MYVNAKGTIVHGTIG